jgi:hypothetical protein
MAADSQNGSDPSGRSEWERFEAFAKQLVAVPKAEIEKARKRGEAKRAKAGHRTSG